MAMLPPWSGRVPADAAVPGSSSSPRHTPIHKQEVHADGGEGGRWGGWLPDLRWCSVRQRDDGRMERGVWKAGCSVDLRGCGRRVQESGRQMWAAEPNFCLLRCGIRLPSPPHNPPHPVPPSLPHSSVPVSPSGRVAFERLKTEIYIYFYKKCHFWGVR